MPGTVIQLHDRAGGELMQDIHEESLNESVKSRAVTAGGALGN